jgi:hypothetical protein
MSTSSARCRDGAIVPDPEGLITAGHSNRTAGTISYFEDDKVNTRALAAMLRQIIANNRAGGWRKRERHARIDTGTRARRPAAHLDDQLGRGLVGCEMTAPARSARRDSGYDSGSFEVVVRARQVRLESDRPVGVAWFDDVDPAS